MQEAQDCLVETGARQTTRRPDSPIASSGRPKPVLGVRVCSRLIRLYQRWLSPWVGNCCRFQPSCSEYMREAIDKHGLRRGLWLGLLRLRRCRPGFAAGSDPVPDADYFELPTFEKVEKPQ